MNELGHQGGPAGLVAGAQAAAAVSVKEFVEQHQVAPVGVALELLQVAEGGAAAALVSLEDAAQAAR